MFLQELYCHRLFELVCREKIMTKKFASISKPTSLVSH
jgi:hypothetical protein